MKKPQPCYYNGLRFLLVDDQGLECDNNKNGESLNALK
jgi:hypothetical protein